MFLTKIIYRNRHILEVNIFLIDTSIMNVHRYHILINLKSVLKLIIYYNSF
jgi:hypothetical protein